MENILPKVPHQKLSGQYKKQTHWTPPAPGGKVSSILESTFTAPLPEESVYATNKLPLKEPNRRYTDPLSLAKLDPSLISEQQRGIPQLPSISATKLNQIISSERVPNYARMVSIDTSNLLLLQMMNMMPFAMDLFIQKKNSIRSFTAQPAMSLIRKVSGDGSVQTARKDELWTIYFSTAPRVTVAMTTRQYVCDFEFTPGQYIGMEVDFIGQKIICVKVLSDSQANVHEKVLIGSQVLMVNQQRVMNIEEFRNAIYYAQQFLDRKIQITVLAYRGGKSKLDELRETNKRQQVKSLLSNLFQRGVTSEADDDESSSFASSITYEEITLDKDNSVENSSVGIIGSKDMIANVMSNAKDEASPSGDRDGLPNEQLLPDHDWDEEGMAASKTRASVDYSNLVDVHKDDGILTSRSSAHSASGDQSEKSNDSAGSWNYMTAVGADTIFPFVRLICVPKALLCSEQWGNPKHFCQFSNYSTDWTIEINWIDEDGSLIPRKEIKPGAAHFELCAVEHVWCLIATYTGKRRTVGLGVSTTDAAIASLEAEESSLQVSSLDGGSLDTSNLYAAEPAVMIMRPNRTVLNPNFSSLVLWSPWSSVTLTQRMITKTIASRKAVQVNAASSRKSKGSDEPINPCIHIQIFNSTLDKLGNFTGRADSAESADPIILKKTFCDSLRRNRTMKYRRK